MVQSIDAAEAKRLMASEAIQIFDMRDFRSYRAGHIEGAVMFHEGLEKSLVERALYDQPFLFYCYRGVKSKEKAQLFANLGFARVYTLENGYTGWPRDAVVAE